MWIFRSLAIGAMCGATAYYGFPHFQERPLELSGIAVLLVLIMLNRKRIERRFNKAYDRFVGHNGHGA